MPVKILLNSFLVIILGCWLLFSSRSGQAEVYSWADESGSMHFTDSPESIPKKFKNKTQIRKDDDDRSWEYLASDYGADYFYDRANVTYLNRNRYRIVIKESYAGAGREEYETQIILDCARQMYKPTQSLKIYKNRSTPVETRGGDDDGGYGGYQDGFRRFTHPYVVLSRMVCKD